MPGANLSRTIHQKEKQFAFNQQTATAHHDQ
jgi:hypothetical protein